MHECLTLRGRMWEERVVAVEEEMLRLDGKYQVASCSKSKPRHFVSQSHGKYFRHPRGIPLAVTSTSMAVALQVVIMTLGRSLLHISIFGLCVFGIFRRLDLSIQKAQITLAPDLVSMQSAAAALSSPTSPLQAIRVCRRQSQFYS